MITVAIIEDDPAVVTRLRDEIQATEDIRVVATAPNAKAGRTIITAGGFDVLLCDLGLPDGEGIDLIRAAVKAKPDVDIIIITMFAQHSKVIDCIKAGACGYLLKEDVYTSCAGSIRQIRMGGSPISPVIARQLLKEMVSDAEAVASQSGQGLSPREYEVLNLLARGFTYQEIAGFLSLAPSSISTYVKRVYRKLEVKSRSEAVFEAGSRGIVNLHQ